MTIKVFGDKAREIEEGQVFIARHVSSEQGDKVELVPALIYHSDGDITPEIRFD